MELVWDLHEVTTQANHLTRYDTKALYMKLPLSAMASVEAHECTNRWRFTQHCWVDMLIDCRGQTSISRKVYRRCPRCSLQNIFAAMATHMFGQDFNTRRRVGWLQIQACAGCQWPRLVIRWFVLINMFTHPPKRIPIKYITIKAIVFLLNAPLLQHGPLSDISRPLRLEFTARQRGLLPRQEGRAAGGPGDDVKTCLPLDGDVHA